MITLLIPIGMLRKTPPLKKRKAGATCPALPLRPPQASSGFAVPARGAPAQSAGCAAPLGDSSVVLAGRCSTQTRQKQRGPTPIARPRRRTRSGPPALRERGRSRADERETACPSGYALCPAATVACTGEPLHQLVEPTCTGTTSDGYDCQVVFSHSRRQDHSACPDGCAYLNEYPSCVTGWLDDVQRHGSLGQRPFRVCDYDPDNPEFTAAHDCAASCAPGCDLRWDAPRLGPVGVCVPVPPTTAAGTCQPADDGADCTSFDPTAGALSCPQGCAFTGSPCHGCPGYASATSSTRDSGLVCTHVATCGDTDGDLSNGLQPFGDAAGCAAGQPLSSNPPVVVVCGNGGCDRATCCEHLAPVQISAAVASTCPNRESDLSAHQSAVQDWALRDPTEWMDAPEELQGLLVCLMAPVDREALCESSGIGSFSRSVLQEFCGTQITRGEASCPTREHHHCCSCYSDDYPLSPDDGHCCGDCANVCSGAASSLPDGDLCVGISGACDPIAFMQVLQDILKEEAIATTTSAAMYASALSLLAPDKVGVFCACRAVGTKMILQGGADRIESEAVEGDPCLPEDHPAGGDSFPTESGPCTTGVYVNLQGDSTYSLSSNRDDPGQPGYGTGPRECRWSISCPAGMAPSVEFSYFMLDPHSIHDESGSDESGDYISLYDGRTVGAPFVAVPAAGSEWDDAVFTGSSGDGDRPAAVASGPNLLFTMSVRGDENDRERSRSACLDSYQPDAPADQRCGAECVITVPPAAETCVPVRPPNPCLTWSITLAVSGD